MLRTCSTPYITEMSCSLVYTIYSGECHAWTRAPADATDHILPFQCRTLVLSPVHCRTRVNYVGVVCRTWKNLFVRIRGYLLNIQTYIIAKQSSFHYFVCTHHNNTNKYLLQGYILFTLNNTDNWSRYINSNSHYLPVNKKYNPQKYSYSHQK